LRCIDCYCCRLSPNRYRREPFEPFCAELVFGAVDRPKFPIILLPEVVSAQGRSGATGPVEAVHDSVHDRVVTLPVGEGVPGTEGTLAGRGRAGRSGLAAEKLMSAIVPAGNRIGVSRTTAD